MFIQKCLKIEEDIFLKQNANAYLVNWKEQKNRWIKDYLKNVANIVFGNFH